MLVVAVSLPALRSKMRFKKDLEYMGHHLLHILVTSLALGHISQAWKMTRDISLSRGERSILDRTMCFQDTCMEPNLHINLVDQNTAPHQLLVTRVERVVSVGELAMAEYYHKGWQCIVWIYGTRGPRKLWKIYTGILDWCNTRDQTYFHVRLWDILWGTSDWWHVKWEVAIGGYLSPLLWTLVVNAFLVEINCHGIYTQDYVNDVRIVGVGRFSDTVSDIVQAASWRDPVLHWKDRSHLRPWLGAKD